MRPQHPRLALVLLATFAGLSPRLGAQASDNDQVVKMSALEVVTTQGHGYVSTNAAEGFKSNESLLDIPQAGVVITADLINDLNFEHSNELMQYFGVEPQQVGTAVEIRGGGAFNPYFDEVPVAPNRFDDAVIDTIEIIKGPTQGLYMLNSNSSGVVIWDSKKPLPFEQNIITVGVNQWGVFRATLDSTGPIGKLGDVLISYRFIAAGQTGNEYFDNYPVGRSIVYPVLQASYHNTTVRFSYYGQHENGSFGYSLMTPSGNLYTGAGRKVNNTPYGSNATQDIYFWQLAVLQKLFDRWDMRVTTQYYKNYQYGAQVIPNSYDWGRQELYFTNRRDDNNQIYWTGVSDVTGRYDIGPSNWQMKNVDTFGAASTFQVVQKYLRSTTLVPFSDSAQGIPLITGQSSASYAVPMNSAAAINAIRVPPLSSYYFPTSGAGSHATTLIGALYWQHSIDVIPDRLTLVGNLAATSINAYAVADISQVPWVSTQSDFYDVVHRWGAIVHVTKEISLYGLDSSNFAPGASGSLLANGTAPPPVIATGNELGMKTALLGGKISTEFAWYHTITTNLTQTTGFLSTGQPLLSLIGKTIQEGVDGDAAFSITRNWQVIGGFFAGHYRDQNGNPLSLTGDNAWGVFSRYAFPTLSSLHGLSFGAGMNRVGTRWVGIAGMTDAVVNHTGFIQVHAANLTNAFVAYDVNKHIRLKLDGSNLLDEAYMAGSGGAAVTDPSLPCTVRAEIDYKF